MALSSRPTVGIVWKAGSRVVSGSIPQLESKYEILGKIKEGGMGAIYKVRHRLLGEIRIVKVMRPQLVDDPGFADRFNREARAAIRLRHPNIAQLFDFSVDEAGNASMVLEYVEGLDLKEVLRRNGPPALGLTLEIAVQALHAIGFLHRRGMVHRDISPDNLMLSRDDDGVPVVKLIDLGIVKLLDADGSMTTTGMFLGKVRYASPEQFRSTEGGAIDQRSDLYSVGIVLYELLTGTFPITGDTSSAIMAGHLYRPPVGFETSDPSGRVPTALRQVVLKLLEKDPARRFQTADELATALRSMQSEFPWLPEDLERCCPAPAAPAAPGETHLGSAQDLVDRGFAGRATPTPGSGSIPAVSPTAPTALLPEGHDGDERAAELLAAFERHVERGEAAEAAALLDSARASIRDEAQIQRLEARLAQLRQAGAPPPGPAPTAAPPDAGALPGPQQAPAGGHPATVPPLSPAASARRGAPLALVAAGVLALIVVVAGSGYLLFGGLARKGKPPAAGHALLGDAGPVDVSATEGMLVIHALPWAEVLEIRGAEGTAVALPSGAVTPLALALPEGDYTVRVRHPGVAESRSAAAHVVAGRTATVTIEVVSQNPDSFLAKMGW